MKLPKYAIEHHQFTIVSVVLLVIFGIISLINMPKSEDPQVSPAGSSVYVFYPGASPKDLEELVIEPIEEVINELDDIRYISSEAEDGFAVVAVEFEPGSDPDEKYADVLQKVSGIENDLPDGIMLVDKIKWTVSDVNIVQLALLADSAGYARLEREADQLKKRMEKVAGVKSVEIHAIPSQEVRISVDMQKLAQLHIPLSRVMGAVMDANTNIPGGHVDVGSKRVNIKTSGSYQSLEEIGSTVVHAAGGRPVYIRDVAGVSLATEDVSYMARYDGRRCIYITAMQKEGTNIFQIFKQLKPVIDACAAELPGDMELAYVFDQSASVSRRVTGFFTNLLQGIFLVGLVVFAAVSSRASLIVMTAIPTSILIGIGFLAVSGYGLEQMSIAGLVIALGLLVDNAIVVTENSARFMRQGYSRSEAAVLGTSQVGWAVVSATTTTLFAFIPIILMRDVTGDFIRSMPLTVVYTLSASLLMSLTFTPYLSARFLRVDHGHRERPARRMLRRFIETRYRSILDWALSHPGRTLGIAAAIFAVSLGLMPLVGVSFFPKAAKPILFVNVDLPAGSSLDETNRIAGEAESILRNHENVLHVAANVGYGNPRLYYNMFPKRQRSNHAQFFVEMDGFSRDRFDRIIADLRSRFARIPGADIEVRELEQGSPVDAPVAVRVMGDNLDVLKEISENVEAAVEAVPGAVNVQNPLGTTKSDLRIRIDRDKAAMLGVPLSEIDRTVRAAMAGLTVSEYHDSEGRARNIVVRLPVSGKPVLEDLNRITVASVTGAVVPLRQLARWELTASSLMISHYNMERSVTVLADVESGRSVDRVTRDVVDRLDRLPWPRGYRYEMGGELENREESFGGMGQAVVIAVIAIFAVLVLQFRCYAQPFIVYSALPLAMIGSVLALLITGNTFSFTAFIGACSLVGIVVNNSIILVDYTNQLRRDGKEMVAALKEAGETRFIPIVLTTMTTVGGLLPLTLSGSKLWAPMGWTIIGGLLTSTFLTLVIVPVLYKLYTPKKIEGQ